MKISRFGPGFIIAGAYLVFGLVTLGDFGVTWDEPAPDHFLVGDLYLETMLQKAWSRLSPSYIGRSMENYGPLFDMWGAINARLFHEKLKLLSADEARHLQLVIAASLTILFTYLLVLRGGTVRMAVFSALFLAAFPRFIGDSFNNPKDTPMAMITVMCFYLFLSRLMTGKRRYSVLLALGGGLGFATRITFLTALLIILSFTILYLFISRRGSHVINGRSAPVSGPPAGCQRPGFFSFWDVWLALLCIVPLGMLFWPYFWMDPLAKFKGVLEFYFRHETQAKLRILYLGKTCIPGISLPWHYAPVMLAVTTPLLTLGWFILGMGAVIFTRLKRGGPGADSPWFKTLGWFLVFWLALGLLPFLLPGQRVYDGIRHFLFVVPALCSLAGRGLESAVALARRFLGTAVAAVAAAANFLALFLIVFGYHPDYTVYYNALVGGPRGAFGKFSLDYWGNSYKRGCEWLNRNLPEGSTVLVSMAPHLARFYARRDLYILGPEAIEEKPRGVECDYSMYVIRDDDPLGEGGREAELAYSIAVKGQPILRIHRWRKITNDQGTITKK